MSESDADYEEGNNEVYRGRKKHHHHNLEEYADFVPNLSPKDKAVLQILTHFVVWAGRYPDPGTGRQKKAEEIFILSEKFQISARDLFLLVSRVMRHAKEVVDGK